MHAPQDAGFHLRSSPIAFWRPPPVKRAYFSLLFPKQVIVFFHRYFVFHYILGFLFPYIFSYCTFIQSLCTYIISFCPKLPITIFIFQVCVLIKYPMKFETLYFSKIGTNICTWSTIKCPYIIFLLLYICITLSVFLLYFFYID